MKASMANEAAAESMPSQPHPRPARSPHRAVQIRVQNRRLEYLRRNPAYVESSDREFVDVRLYDKLIRSYQTPAERTAEAQDKGFGHVLEASMLRNPERLHRIGSDEEEEEEEEEEGRDNERETNGLQAASRPMHNGNNAADASGDDQDDLNLDWDLDDDEGTPGEAARRRWHAFVRDWFVRGGAADDGFDYRTVDDDSDYDALARADAEDAWFDDESPGWSSEDDEDGGVRMRTGETGIQDF